MDLSLYQRMSRQTADYPDVGLGLVYPTLGLIGEAGEVSDKIKKLVTHSHGKEMTTSHYIYGVIHELGDVLWYIAAICHELNADMDRVAKRTGWGDLRYSFEHHIFGGEQARKRHEILRSRKTASWYFDSDLLLLALDLCGYASQVSEVVKRIFRDDGGELTPERRERILEALGNVVWCLDAISSVLDVDLAMVAEINLSKLRSRRRRAVLHGDGDTR